MKTFWLPVVSLLALAAPSARGQFATKVRPVLEKNCFACHGAQLQTADVDFSAFKDDASAAAKKDLWLKVREKLEAHLMPPPPIPGLSAAESATIIQWIDSVAGAPKTTSSGGSNPGARDGTPPESSGIQQHPARLPRRSGASGG